jgi:hypothetical protein
MFLTLTCWFNAGVRCFRLRVGRWCPLGAVELFSALNMEFIIQREAIMNIKSLAIAAVLLSCAAFSGCASIPASQNNLHTPMSVNATTKVFEERLQNCSGTISGIWGEDVVVTHQGHSVVLSLHSNTADHITTLGTSAISDHFMHGLYTISPAAGGGSVVYVKPNISALKAGGFVSPSKRALAGARNWIAGNQNCD